MKKIQTKWLVTPVYVHMKLQRQNFKKLLVKFKNRTQNSKKLFV